MSQGEILTIFKNAIMTAILIAAPVLLVTAAVGLVVAVIQAATQIQEQSIAFIIKLAAVALILILLGSWNITTMLDYMNGIFDSMSRIS